MLSFIHLQAVTESDETSVLDENHVMDHPETVQQSQPDVVIHPTKLTRTAASFKEYVSKTDSENTSQKVEKDFAKIEKITKQLGSVQVLHQHVWGGCLSQNFYSADALEGGGGVWAKMLTCGHYLTSR